MMCGLIVLYNVWFSLFGSCVASWHISSYVYDLGNLLSATKSNTFIRLSHLHFVPPRLPQVRFPTHLSAASLFSVSLECISCKRDSNLNYLVYYHNLVSL